LAGLAAVVAIAAVAWPRAGPARDLGPAGTDRSDQLDAPICTQLDASTAPTDGSVIAECPAGTEQASAMLGAAIGEPTALPPGWVLTESTVLLQQDPDGRSEQQFHRIWRAPDFDPAAGACAPKILLDARVPLPGEPPVPPGQTPVTTLANGAPAYGRGFASGQCEGPPATPGTTGILYWSRGGVAYELFSFAVPQDEALAFAASA
jgi:hypothetical protein